VPKFSCDIELLIAEENKSYYSSGTHFHDASVQTATMQDLTKAIFSYTSYTSSTQISSVAEALVEKFPCLKEPESFAGMHGWQQHTRCTISKLKSQKYTYPELEANRLKRKLPTNAAPAKNVKRHL